MDTNSKKLDKYILAVISLGFMIWGMAFIYKSSFIAIDGKRYFCLFDDAMISMRYAWNFSHGLGLVWNQGDFVQGYTNLLMTLLMSLSTWIFDKETAVLFVQILGLVFMLAIAYITMLITGCLIPKENNQRRRIIQVLSFLGALSYYPLAYWSLMGMETGLLTLLLLLSIHLALNYKDIRSTSFLFLASGFMGLAFLTRNDSIIFTILIWLFIIWETRKTNNSVKKSRFLLTAIGLYTLIVIGQLVFQYSYYGELLPNTYTLKLTGTPLLYRIKDGIRFVIPFIKETIFIIFLSAIDLFFDFQPRKLLLFSIALSTISYQVYIGGDPWAYWRIMSPSMPLFIILFIIAANSIVFTVSSTKSFRVYFLRNPILPKKYINHFLLVSLVLAELLLANNRFLMEILLVNKPYQVEDNRINTNTAIVISEVTRNDASIGVFWAGAIPYFTDRKAIDFLGKSDRHIAQLSPDLSGSVSWSGMKSVPGHNKYDLTYSIKILKPTYVQGFTWGSFAWGSQNISQWAETEYVMVEYDGIPFFLLKDSPSVLWSKIDIP